MKRPSLLSQILALNLLMVTAGIFVATVASGVDFTIEAQRSQFLILVMTLLVTFLLNTLLLRRRFEPLERLLAMMELLDLARQLRPTALDDHGLVAALRTHVREQDRRGPANVAFWSDPRVGELPSDVQVVIYRVAQEALVNAARHSGATRIEVN